MSLSIKEQNNCVRGSGDRRLCISRLGFRKNRIWRSFDGNTSCSCVLTWTLFSGRPNNNSLRIENDDSFCAWRNHLAESFVSEPAAFNSWANVAWTRQGLRSGDGLLRPAPVEDSPTLA